MDISPQRVRTAEFKSVKRGLDPDEVRAFLAEVATELERAQNQSTAMEARARAAVARLQELSEGVGTSSETPPPKITSVTPSVDESETISRTLLLAQRTADTTVAEAEALAQRLKAEAEDEAAKTIDSTREMSVRLLDEARDEARRAGLAERSNVEAEVSSLMARRDFLESDVDHLERHIADERSRLREAATTLLDLVERVPGGLGQTRRPLISGSDEEPTEAVVASSTFSYAETAQPAETSVDDDADHDSFPSLSLDLDSDDGAPDSTDEFGTFELPDDETGGIMIRPGDLDDDDNNNY